MTGLLAPLGGRNAAHFQGIFDILQGRAPGKERILLKDIGRAGMRLRHLDAVDAGNARGRPGQPRNHVKQHRLAAAGGPDQRDELAAIDAEIDAVEHRDPVGGHAVHGHGLSRLQGKGLAHPIDSYAFHVRLSCIQTCATRMWRVGSFCAPPARPRLQPSDRA